MSLLRSCQRGVSQAWSLRQGEAAALVRLFSSGSGQEGTPAEEQQAAAAAEGGGGEGAGREAAAAGGEGRGKAKRVAMPHKVTLMNCDSYMYYLRQRWRFRPSEPGSSDARALYRLANILEYQNAQGLRLTTLLQQIVTESVASKEQLRRQGNEKEAESMEETIKRVIGAMVWYKRASRPTFEAVDTFRNVRVEKIKKALAERGPRRGKRAQRAEPAEAEAEAEEGEEEAGEGADAKP